MRAGVVDYSISANLDPCKNGFRFCISSSVTERRSTASHESIVPCRRWPSGGGGGDDSGVVSTESSDGERLSLRTSRGTRSVSVLVWRLDEADAGMARTSTAERERAPALGRRGCGPGRSLSSRLREAGVEDLLRASGLRGLERRVRKRMERKLRRPREGEVGRSLD